MDLGHYCFDFSKEGQCSREENISMIQKKNICTASTICKFREYSMKTFHVISGKLEE